MLICLRKKKKNMLICISSKKKRKKERAHIFHTGPATWQDQASPFSPTAFKMIVLGAFSWF